MNGKLAELARRREGLVSQAAAQRAELARSREQLQRPIRVARTLIQTLSAHPALVMALTALLVGGSVDRMARSLVKGWQIARRIRERWFSRKK